MLYHIKWWETFDVIYNYGYKGNKFASEVLRYLVKDSTTKQCNYIPANFVYPSKQSWWSYLLILISWQKKLIIIPFAGLTCLRVETLSSLAGTIWIIFRQIKLFQDKHSLPRYKSKPRFSEFPSRVISLFCVSSLGLFNDRTKLNQAENFITTHPSLPKLSLLKWLRAHSLDEKTKATTEQSMSPEHFLVYKKIPLFNMKLLFTVLENAVVFFF